MCHGGWKDSSNFIAKYIYLFFTFVALSFSVILLVLFYLSRMRKLNRIDDIVHSMKNQLIQPHQNAITLSAVSFLFAHIFYTALKLLHYLPAMIRIVMPMIGKISFFMLKTLFVFFVFVRAKKIKVNGCTIFESIVTLRRLSFLLYSL